MKKLTVSLILILLFATTLAPSVEASVYMGTGPSANGYEGSTAITWTNTTLYDQKNKYCVFLYKYKATSNNTLYLDLPLDPHYKGTFVNGTDLTNNTKINVARLLDTNNSRERFIINNALQDHTYGLYFNFSCTPNFTGKVFLDNGTLNFTADTSVKVIYGSETWYIVSFNATVDGKAYLYSKYVSLGFNVANITSNGTTVPYTTKTGSLWIIFNVSNGNTYTAYTYNTSSLSLGGGAETTSTTNTMAGAGAVATTTAIVEKIKVLLVKQKDVVFWAGVILLAIIVLFSSKRRRR